MSNQNQTPEMLSTNELAERYGVSLSTIYRRIKDGTLKPHRLGARTLRFDAAEAKEAFRA